MRCFARLAAFISLVVFALPSSAQVYPSKPIRVIVPFPAGGGTDFVARTVTQHLGDLLGQPVVIDNRSGASGVIGVEAAVRSKPDGHTILIADVGALAINPSLFQKIPFNVRTDLIPVSLIAKNPMILVVNPTVLPVANLKELVTKAKQSPGSITYASFGAGSIAHVVAELFATRANIKLLHVPFRGNAPALQDVLGGRVALMFSGYPTVQASLTAGKLHGLAVSSKNRLSTVPDIPSIHEAGFEGFDAFNWVGCMVPAGTPSAIVAKLSEALAKAANSPDVQKRLSQTGVLSAASSPAEFASFFREDLERWNGVVTKLGLKLDN